MIRFFDIFLSIIGLVLLSPVFILICIWVKLDSKGAVFYKQIRVGRNNVDFELIKFRTMQMNSEQKGLLTIGERDSRITKSGFYIRKYKIDELPQLINVLKGEMSIVGPRPEVRKYVNYYTDEQKKILFVKPGITDVASIKYSNENEILKKHNDPEKAYIEIIMLDKIQLNMKYISNYSISNYFKIIFLTIKCLF